MRRPMRITLSVTYRQTDVSLVPTISLLDHRLADRCAADGLTHINTSCFNGSGLLFINYDDDRVLGSLCDEITTCMRQPVSAGARFSSFIRSARVLYISWKPPSG